MSKQVRRNAKVVRTKETDIRDEMALRKVARAVLAIARRQIEQEASSTEAREEANDEGN